MRTKALATSVCAIFVPTMLIYYIYYDSLSERTVTPRYTADIANPSVVLTDSHKYAGIWQQQFNTSRRAAVRALFQTPTLPTPEQSRDPVDHVEEKRLFIKEMMKESWNSYVRYAWGYNELKPVTREAKTDSIFGASKIGATIVDAMDTLLIMDMKAEFTAARNWVANSFHFKATENEVSVFETVIRFVGGLLTCFAMTGDEMFLNKSREVAEALLPAYGTQTGLPHGLIVPATGKNYHHSWAFGSILSEMGSQHLEYVYLSDMTGDKRFRDHAFAIRNRLEKAHKPNGLYMTMMDSSTGQWNENKSTVGALGDSFYEYLIKTYVQTRHRDKTALRMYTEAMEAVERNQMINTSRTGLRYIADWIYGKPNNKMQHLTCFAGGMFALGAHHMAQDLVASHPVVSSNELHHHQQQQNSSIQAQQDLVKHYMELAINVTETCFQSYNRTPTKLGPESFFFDDQDDATNRQGDMYILRPEVVESFFILWRLTKDNRWREYAWSAALALHRHCRTGHGYSGIHNVMADPPTKDNTQQSFFLAETLKYLYLIFSNDQLIPLEQWVFNTEAHPLPICGANTAYPGALCNSVFE